MKIQKQFRPGAKLVLSDADAVAKPLSSGDKTTDLAQVAGLAAKIGEQQVKLYAGGAKRLLVILQGTDTSGKDGTVDSVFAGVNVQGINVVSFKTPNTTELRHDYLWRIHQRVPLSGEMVVFNRSHYEDVLITRVHDWIDHAECERRYAQIRDFERMLVETGTTVLKFFLHISKDEQRARLQSRIDDPTKNWKFEPQDLVERGHWDRYQQLYAAAINATDTDDAPWHVIPADSKTHRNLAVASIVSAALEDMKLKFPPADPKLVGVKVV